MMQRSSRTGHHFPAPRRAGFVFLLSVLAIGVIAASTAASLLLLGGAAELTSFSVQQSLQALEFARACEERALLNIRRNPSYGGEGHVWPRGSCRVTSVQQQGGSTVICAEGRSGRALRRMEVTLARLYPTIIVSGWQEAVGSSVCMQ